jgi:hypothetical protein
MSRDTSRYGEAFSPSARRILSFTLLQKDIACISDFAAACAMKDLSASPSRWSAAEHQIPASGVSGISPPHAFERIARLIVSAACAVQR